MSAAAKKTVLVGIAFAILVGGFAVVLVSVTGDEAEPVVAVPGGDADAGKELIADYGCGACHHIPGVRGADGKVGPPLGNLAERRYIAGDEPNRLDVLIEWIQNPQELEPGTVMPDLGVSETEARDIAAYLYSR